MGEVNERMDGRKPHEPWQERGEPAGRSHGLLMNMYSCCCCSCPGASWGRRRRRIWQWRGLVFH